MHTYMHKVNTCIQYIQNKYTPATIHAATPCDPDLIAPGPWVCLRMRGSSRICTGPAASLRTARRTPPPARRGTSSRAAPVRRSPPAAPSHPMGGLRERQVRVAVTVRIRVRLTHWSWWWARRTCRPRPPGRRTTPRRRRRSETAQHNTTQQHNTVG